MTRRVQTDNLGQQVSYPLSGYHVAVGKSRIRTFFLTRLSLHTHTVAASVHQIPSLSVGQDFVCKTAWMEIEHMLRDVSLKKQKQKPSEQIPTLHHSLSFLASGNEHNTNTSHTLAQITDGSQENLPLRTLFFSISPILRPKTLDVLLPQFQSVNHKRPFRYHSKK